MKRIDVIKAFLSDASACHTPNHSLSYGGAYRKVLFSYATPIALIVGNKCYVNSLTKYSMTTSHHQSMTVREAKKQGFEVFCVKDLSEASIG